MDLKIPYIKVKKSSEAFAVVEKFLTNEGLGSIPFTPQYNFDKQNNKIEATGNGFKILAIFNEQHVDISIDLSFLYRAFKGKLISLLEAQLKKHL